MTNFRLGSDGLAAGLLVLALLVAPDAHKAECGSLNERYDAAVAKITEALRRYEKCVATSDKRNDCAAEIQALDDAHDDFADVIDDIRDCR